MEDEKLQRLHDTLSKLAPRGKVGGLGFTSFAKQAKGRDSTLPNNPLYSHFVRAGHGEGQYHKRKFGDGKDDDKDSDEDEEGMKTSESKKEKKEIPKLPK